MLDVPQPKESADWLRALERTAQAARAPKRTFGVVLDELATQHGARPALIGKSETLTFAALAALANRYARWALANGIQKGDCVALLMTNCPAYVAIWAGISRAGGVVALINTHLRGSALAHCLDVAQPRHVIVGDDMREAFFSAGSQAATVKLWVDGEPALRNALAALDDSPLSVAEQPDVTLADRALYIYTSGTTGLPKAANVSHRRVIEWSTWFAGLMNVTPDDRMYNCLPMYHSVGGIVAIGSALVAGGSVVIREKFSARTFWDDVVQTESTLFQYIGELCRFLVAAPPNVNDTKHRLRICCGNGLRPDVWETFKTRFKIPRILEFYAATEGSFSLYNVEGKPGALGRLPGFLAHRSPVALVKFDTETATAARNPGGLCIPCDDNEPGEAIGRLARSGKDDGNRFEGYSNKAEGERKILRDVFVAGDAWFRTGDLMKRDKAGYYYFVDRIGDTFRWKGENVSTLEVANALTSCPGIMEATVYGVAVPGCDGRAGMAAIVTDGRFSPQALHEHLLTQLPSYARPQFIRIVAELAVTETFKQKKQILIDEGYNLVRVRDALLINDVKQGAYVPLTVDRLAQLSRRT